jgi:hypothetical protein
MLILYKWFWLLITKAHVSAGGIFELVYASMAAATNQYFGRFGKLHRLFT